MNILLICGSGVSTGLLLKEMKKYWLEQGIELHIRACGISSFQEHLQEFDIIMVGPQVKYMLKHIKEICSLPCEAIAAMDYATANCENIMKLAQRLYQMKE